MSDLTDKQKVFIQEYLIDLNATQAAIRAGYSEDTARQIGSENLSKPVIQKAISKEQKERQERTHVTQDEVIKDLIEVKERCLQRIPVKDKEGHETGEYVFKEHGVLKALELLGKHLKMFTDKIDHSGEIKTTSNHDLSKLNDEELIEYKKLLSKISD